MSILSDLILMAESNDNRNIDELAADSLLGCMQEDDTKPNFRTVFKFVKDKTIKQPTGLSCDEIMNTARSVADGRLVEDIRDLVLVVVEVIPDLTHTLPESIDLLMERLRKFPNLMHERFEDLKHHRGHITVDGRIEELDDPSVKLFKDTLVALLGNDTFVTALVVYANLNKVPIEKQDVFFVRDQLQKPGIDMPALVEKGEARLKEKYEIGKAKDILARLQHLRK